MLLSFESKAGDENVQERERSGCGKGRSYVGWLGSGLKVRGREVGDEDMMAGMVNVRCCGVAWRDVMGGLRRSVLGYARFPPASPAFKIEKGGTWLS